MALRHSDRHLDPHGHSHGPWRDELHGWRIARACIRSLGASGQVKTIKWDDNKKSDPSPRCGEVGLFSIVYAAYERESSPFQSS